MMQGGWHEAALYSCSIGTPRFTGLAMYVTG